MKDYRESPSPSSNAKVSGFAISILAIFCVFASATVAVSQDLDLYGLNPDVAKGGWLTAVNESDFGDFKVTPLVFPFYSPTLEGAIGVGILSTFLTDKNDVNLPRSTAQVTGMYSTLDAYALGARVNTFWKGDTIRGQFVAAYSETPDNYAGVGFDNGNSVERGPNTTLFDGTAFAINPRITYRVGEEWFVGINYSYRYQDAQDVAPLMAADPNFQFFGSRYKDSGIGLVVSRDTRDVTLDAREGELFEFRTTHNRKWMGSDYEWDAYDLDLRHYRPFLRDGSTLALLLQGRYTSGQVPWASMTSVGSSRDLRGYHLGQYRDKTGVWGVAEYRHRFRMKSNPDPKSEPGFSKHSVVGWLGLGFIGNDLGDLGGHSLPNAGVGYRFEIQDRRHLRFDYGFGRDGESGLYVSFNQAF